MPAVDPSIRDQLAVWTNFARANRHLLRRNQPSFHGPEASANMILLQLACEHANDSPVTHAAEEWLQKGHCNWMWLRKLNRPKKYITDPCLAVLEGHENRISQVIELDGSILISKSSHQLSPRQEAEQFPLRIWDIQNGNCIASLSKGDQSELSDGRIVFFSDTGLISVSDPDSGIIRQLDSLQSNTRKASRPVTMVDGRIVSPSIKSGKLELMNPATGKCCGELRGHSDYVTGVCQLLSGNILSWSKDCTLRVWAAEGQGHPPSQRTHGDDIGGTIQLNDGQVLSWSIDDVYQIWNLESYECDVTFPDEIELSNFQLTPQPDGVVQLRDDRILVWEGMGDQGFFRVWDARGEFLDGYSFETAKELHADVWAAFKKHKIPKPLYHHKVEERLENSPYVIIRSKPGGLILSFSVKGRGIECFQWEGEGRTWSLPRNRFRAGWVPRLSLARGMIIASSFNNLVFLGLHYGDQPISFSNAQKLLTKLSGEIDLS
jgi:WD40 repeat protein